MHGRHHIPGIGTLFHHQGWFYRRVQVRFLSTGQTRWLTFTTDPTALIEIITAGRLAEARTLMSLCLTDP
ncbi:hypothetical protein JTP67_01300 [Streptomyces sp. S12]|nr:hypothetical protein [Streptomyces sp. S12]